MRKMRTAAFVIGALLTLPASGLASQTAASMHEIRGIVRSLDETRLIIRQWPDGRSMRFVLNPSTEREGLVKVGATVEVRYSKEADKRIATDVIVEHAKARVPTSGAHR